MHMATEGQKNMIRDLLKQRGANLADFTAKEMRELTVTDASVIIADLKSLQFIRRCRKNANLY